MVENTPKMTRNKFIAGISIGILVLILGIVAYFLKFDFNLVLLLLVFGGGLTAMIVVANKGVTYTEKELEYSKKVEEAYLISTGAGSKYFLLWVSVLLFSTLIFIVYAGIVLYSVTLTGIVLTALPITIIGLVIAYFGIRDVRTKQVGKYDKYFGYANVILAVYLPIHGMLFPPFFSLEVDLPFISLNLIFGIYIILKTRKV